MSLSRFLGSRILRALLVLALVSGCTGGGGPSGPVDSSGGTGAPAAVAPPALPDLEAASALEAALPGVLLEDEIPLDQGWNLISFPVAEVTEVTPGPGVFPTLFAFSGGTYQAVALSPEQINAGEGTVRAFWAFAGEPSSLGFEGPQGPDLPDRVRLLPGFNLVGFPVDEPAPLGGVMIQAGTHASAIRLVDAVCAETPPSDPSCLVFQTAFPFQAGAYRGLDLSQPDTLVSPGESFWVFAHAPVTMFYREAPAPARLRLQGTPAFETGGSPRGAVLGDFNRDGLADLATANSSSGDVTVLAGTGDGGFAASTVTFGAEISATPRGIAAGDFDGDGLEDLVVASSSGIDGTLLLPGVGDGTFSTPRTRASNDDPLAPVAAHVDSDGHLDLVTVSDLQDRVVVWLGAGDGTFPTLRTAALGNSEAADVVAADLDGDEDIDLAVSDTRNDGVHVLLGRGDGTFAAPVLFAAGSEPAGLVAEDLDGDEVLDLAVANEDSGDVSLLIGDGSGGFAAPQDLPAGPMPQSVLASDVTGDGRTDLVVPLLRGDALALLESDGSGGFLPSRLLPAGSSALQALAGDFDQDGRPDLAALSLRDHVGVLLGEPGGRFLTHRNEPVGTGPLTVAAADLDADGRLDFVTTDQVGDTLSLRFGVGDGTFDRPASLPTGGGPRAVAVADLNGDAHLDLAFAEFDANSFSVYPGSGGGAFGSRVTAGSFTGPSALLLGLFDGDGFLDAVLSSPSTTRLFRGRDDGTFGAASTVAGGGAVQAALVNQDAFLDLVALGSDLFIHLGLGDGTFTEGDPIDVVPSGGLLLADLDGTSTQDAILGTSLTNEPSLTILPGLGDGTFGAAQAIEAGPSLEPVAFADMDGDGHGDLVLVSGARGVVVILLGDGAGGFSEPLAYAVGATPSSVATGDLNGDGRLDLLVTNSAFAGSNSVSVLLGR